MPKVIQNLGKIDLVRVNSRMASSGTECQFYKISKTQGMKCFDDYDHAVRSMERQAYLAEQGIAPKVRGPICVADLNLGHGARTACYAYKTEYTRPMTWNEYRSHRKLVNNLIEQVRSLWPNIPHVNPERRGMGDIHSENFGWSGRFLVIIDTNDLSFA